MSCWWCCRNCERPQLRRRGDVAHIMKWRRVRLAQLRQCVNDIAAQFVHGLEEPQDLVRLSTFLERLQLLRTLAHLHVSDADGVVLVHYEHESGNAALTSAVVLHFRD